MLPFHSCLLTTLFIMKIIYTGYHNCHRDSCCFHSIDYLICIRVFFLFLATDRVALVAEANNIEAKKMAGLVGSLVT